MKFVLIDRITEIEPGKRVVAQKALSLAEEYLADHFPTFPVLPGVLMLEAMVQASAWLARVSLDFAPAVVVLKEARNVTYKSFLAPGKVLTIESQCKEMSAEQSVYSGRGEVDGREIVKGQFTLRHVALAAADEGLGAVEERLRGRLRALYELLTLGHGQRAPAAPAL